MTEIDEGDNLGERILNGEDEVSRSIGMGLGGNSVKKESGYQF